MQVILCIDMYTAHVVVLYAMTLQAVGILSFSFRRIGTSSSHDAQPGSRGWSSRRRRGEQVEDSGTGPGAKRKAGEQEGGAGPGAKRRGGEQEGGGGTGPGIRRKGEGGGEGSTIRRPVRERLGPKPEDRR